MNAVDMSGPEYFCCERLSCRMLRKHCLQNQQLANQAYAPVNGFLGVPEVAYARSMTCIDCEQGKQIAKEEKTAMSFPSKQRGRPPKQKPEEEIPLVNPCRRCGVHEAIVSGNGRIIHGLCRECFTVRQTATKRHNARVIVLDLNPHPELFEKLQGRSSEQLRSVRDQALWDLLQVAAHAKA